MELKVVLAGGGTAGHVNPLLATAQELIRRGHSVTVLGTEEGLESTLVPEAGLALVTMPKAPFPRRINAEAFRAPRKIKQATDVAKEALQNADVLVGFGGYVSAPAYLAASTAGVPYVVQEQNVKPGLANWAGARRATALSLAFPQTRLKAKNGETVFTGMPLRQSIVELGQRRSTPEGARAAKEEAAEQLGLDPDLPTLLVMGGSLGAQHLNEVLVEAATSGVFTHAAQMQIVHLAGKGKAEKVVSDAPDLPNVVWEVHEYLAEMELALAVADLVVARSGAGTVAELGYLGLPAIYVPLPIGNGEQERNAEQQILAGGAVAVKDADFSVRHMAEHVLPLLFDSAALKEKSEAMRSTSPGDGASLLADLTERSAKGGSQ